MQLSTTIHSFAGASLALALIACGGALASTPPAARPSAEPTAEVVGEPAALAQPAVVEPTASAEPEQATPTKQDECAVLTEKLSATSPLRVSVQTRSPDGDGSEEDRFSGVRACERVRARLPKAIRASALIGCDVSLITLSADATLLAKLCADRDVYMVTEDQPVVLE